MFERNVSIRGHGTAFLPELVGPGRLALANSVPWSDINGVRRGGGVTFAGAPNTRNYFHLSFPVLDAVLFNPALAEEGLGQALIVQAPATNALTLLFSTSGSAAVTHVALFDGAERYWFDDRNDAAVLSGATAPVARPNVPINVTRRSPTRGLGLSVGVAFGAGRPQITFTAATVKMVYTFFEPSDQGP